MLFQANRKSRSSNQAYWLAAAIAAACAIAFAAIRDTGSVPVLGAASLVPSVVIAALIGWPLLTIIHRIGIGTAEISQLSLRNAAIVIGFGAVLTLPPVAIDLWLGFPPDMNVPMPEALFFYPAIGFVAEVVFHLLPLAILAVISRGCVSVTWVLLPVVFVEPLFQIIFVNEFGLKVLLVFANVSLIGAVQLWLFKRGGFGAMMALRLSFYLFWHVIWGVMRLA